MKRLLVETADFLRDFPNRVAILTIALAFFAGLGTLATGHTDNSLDYAGYATAMKNEILNGIGAYLPSLALILGALCAIMLLAKLLLNIPKT